MASLVEVPEKHPGALNESMEGANFVKELWFVESIGGGVDVGDGEGEVV